MKKMKFRSNQVIFSAFLIGFILFLLLMRLFEKPSESVVPSLGLSLLSIYTVVMFAYYARFRALWKSAKIEGNENIILIFAFTIILWVLLVIMSKSLFTVWLILIGLSISQLFQAFILAREIVRIEAVAFGKKGRIWSIFLIVMNPIYGIWNVFGRMDQVENKLINQ